MLTTDNWVIVKVGREGEIARTVQHLLAAQGHPTDVDGVIGPKTDSAIKAFQTAHALTVDGIVGNDTWPVLIITISEGAEGPAVEAAQGQLRLRNLPATTTLAVDGVFGSATDTAVKAFQQVLNDQNFLTTPVDGIVGRDTWFALANNFAGPDV